MLSTTCRPFFVGWREIGFAVCAVGRGYVGLYGRRGCCFYFVSFAVAFTIWLASLELFYGFFVKAFFCCRIAVAIGFSGSQQCCFF